MRGWLKDCRLREKYTMAEMGKKLGITESYYSLIEKGTRQKPIDLTMAAKLADIFSLSIKQIVEFESEDGD